MTKQEQAQKIETAAKIALKNFENNVWDNETMVKFMQWADESKTTLSDVETCIV